MISRKVFISFLIGLCFAYTTATAEEVDLCSTKAAEPCLAARKQKYSDALKAYSSGRSGTDLKFEELGPKICLTQIRDDDDGRCFETNTELCAKDQAKEMKQDWNNLNNDITELCQTVCPKFLDIATCKNLTVSGEIKDSRFEKFCSSFNESLMCAKTALSDCEFGMSIYYAALDYQIMPYWNEICNSGCPNIDQTVGVIKSCAKPLKDLGSKPDMADLCLAHYNFKQCIFGSPIICQEQVTALIKFMYKKYFRIDFFCKTTTSTTTTAAITTTTTTSTIPTTGFFTSSSETTSAIVPDIDPSVIYTSCISEESIDKMASENQLSASIALNLMELEECIYGNLTSGDPSSTMAVSMYHMPPALWKLYKSYKQTGYRVIMEAIKDRCHKNVPSGCTGHRYGLIECEPSDAAQCYSVTLLQIMTLLILNTLVS